MTADAVQTSAALDAYTAQHGSAFPASAEQVFASAPQDTPPARLFIPSSLNIGASPPPRQMPTIQRSPRTGYLSGEQQLLQVPDSKTRIVARADVSTGRHPANLVHDSIANPSVSRPPTYLQGSLRAQAGPLVAELTRSAGEGTKPRKSDSYSIGTSGSTPFGGARAVISGALPAKGTRETPTAALTLDNACNTLPGALCLSLDLSAPMSKSGMRKPTVSLGTEHLVHDDGHSSLHIGTGMSRSTQGREASVYVKARF